MEKTEVLTVLKEVVSYIIETHIHWDNNEDHKVGKRLRALAGDMKGYHPVPDKLHELIKNLEQDCC